MPPPSRLLRKILIKNKRLKPDDEKQQLELYTKGQFVIGEEDSEDTAGGDNKATEAAEAAAANHTGSVQILSHHFSYLSNIIFSFKIYSQCTSLAFINDQLHSSNKISRLKGYLKLTWNSFFNY